MRLESLQLIDELLELDVERREVLARSTVPHDSTIYSEHFPGYPVVPGTLLTEAMAHVCCRLVLELDDYRRLAVLSRITRATLREFAAPGDELQLKGQVVYLGDQYAVATGAVEKRGRTIADAELRFQLVPFPEDKMRDWFGNVRAELRRVRWPRRARESADG